MELDGRVFGITIMVLILLFSVIHLGVSIGIIVPYRQYGAIFRPQVGLSAFNLVICILGFVTGGLGVFSILKNNRSFGKIVAIISGVLGIFTLASLIAALVINSKSLSFVSGCFSDNMNQYQTNQNARIIVDNLQAGRLCCGENMWLDWSRINLNGIATLTTTSLTTVSSGNNLTTIIGNTTIQTNVSSTTIAQTSSGTSVNTPTASAMSSVTQAGSSSTGTLQTSSSGGSTTNTPTVAGSSSAGSTGSGATGTAQTSTGSNGISTAAAIVRHIRRQSHIVSDSSRRKRQAVSTYGGISGLPLSFNVTLPLSCCTFNAIATNTTSASYCQSVVNGTPNSFYVTGCSKSLDTTASNQAMGIGVINCFMIALAFVAIPVLVKTPSV